MGAADRLVAREEEGRSNVTGEGRKSGVKVESGGFGWGRWKN